MPELCVRQMLKFLRNFQSLLPNGCTLSQSCKHMMVYDGMVNLLNFSSFVLLMCSEINFGFNFILYSDSINILHSFLISVPSLPKFLLKSMALLFFYLFRKIILFIKLVKVFYIC